MDMNSVASVLELKQATEHIIAAAMKTFSAETGLKIQGLKATIYHSKQNSNTRDYSYSIDLTIGL